MWASWVQENLATSGELGQIGLAKIYWIYCHVTFPSWREQVLDYLFILKDLFISREKGREGGRGRETSIGSLSHAPNWGPGPQARRVSGLESNQGPFGSQACAQSTEPHRPGLGRCRTDRGKGTGRASLAKESQRAKNTVESCRRGRNGVLAFISFRASFSSKTVFKISY